mmetsp:Transcript_22972/g.63942  ORF Transcript_22972/g.63942 Transcript_22972/m.63942 type:complete len:171 (+) Transcript_22972:1463-1975(+)
MLKVASTVVWLPPRNPNYRCNHEACIYSSEKAKPVAKIPCSFPSLCNRSNASCALRRGERQSRAKSGIIAAFSAAEVSFQHGIESSRRIRIVPFAPTSSHTSLALLTIALLDLLVPLQQEFLVIDAIQVFCTLLTLSIKWLGILQSLRRLIVCTQKQNIARLVLPASKVL